MGWYAEWFNEDYLALYAHRSDDQAADQVTALQKLLKLNGQERILDLSCGAGRHLIVLAERGYAITGIDLSPSLVAEARKKIAAKQLTAVVHRRDMRDLNGLGEFDLVVCLFTSFGYLPTPQDDQQVLEAVATILRPEGRFVLDFLNPAHVRANLVPTSEMLVGDQPVHIRRAIDGDCVIKEIEFPHRTYQERVRLYSRADLTRLCTNIGLRPTAWYSDFAGTPWQEQSERQLLVATKSRGAKT